MPSKPGVYKKNIVFLDKEEVAQCVGWDTAKDGFELSWYTMRFRNSLSRLEPL